MKSPSPRACGVWRIRHRVGATAFTQVILCPQHIVLAEIFIKQRWLWKACAIGFAFAQAFFNLLFTRFWLLTGIIGLADAVIPRPLTPKQMHSISKKCFFLPVKQQLIRCVNPVATRGRGYPSPRFRMRQPWDREGAKLGAQFTLKAIEHRLVCKPDKLSLKQQVMN